MLQENKVKFLSRTDQSFLSKWFWSMDRWLLFLFTLLMILGFLLVFSGSYGVAIGKGYNPYHFTIKHFIFLIPTFGVMCVTSLFSEQGIKKVSIFMFVMACLMLLAVPVIGHSVKGAARWIRFGPLSVQPSEFVKPFFAVVIAMLLSKGFSKNNFKNVMYSAGILAVIVLFLLKQPDVGQTVIMSGIWGAEIFIAGAPFLLIVALILLGSLGLVGLYFMLPHFASRLNRFLNPAVGDNYQVEKSLDAFRSGALGGKGPAQGIVSTRLPDSHADFIFAVAGEEWGAFVAVFLILLFAFVIVRSFRSALKTKDLFTILAVSGLILQIGLQSIVHIGASLRLMPAKGMTLPFISYGGSSMIALGFAAGIILALTKDKTRL